VCNGSHELRSHVASVGRFGQRSGDAWRRHGRADPHFVAIRYGKASAASCRSRAPSRNRSRGHCSPRGSTRSGTRRSSQRWWGVSLRVTPAEERSAQRRHELIMRRFHRVIEERHDQPLYIPETCNLIGVAERTLRMCCHEQLGMSAKQFLLARRMIMVRRDLRMAAPTATTVTEIATRYGFWEVRAFCW
jgi:AraC-like DNA-binding protein